MNEPAEEQPDPRSIPRMSAIVPRKTGDWPGTKDEGLPFIELSPSTLGPQGRDKTRMAATASEGTARKPVCVNAAARSPRANSGNEIGSTNFDRPHNAGGG